MALAFAQAGVSGLVLTGRDQEALQETASEAASKAANRDVRIETIVCDVLKDEDVAKLAKRVQETHGRIDCLILNAGTPVSLQRTQQEDGSLRLDWPKGIHDHGLSDFRRVVDTNLMSAVTVLHYILPLLVESSDGPQTVVIVSSSAANNVDPKSIPVAYSLSKMANARLAELVHEGYDGGKENGLVVVGLQPGSVLTGEEVPLTI